MAKPGPRGSYAKSAARRDTIAQAVLDIVNESGHRSLTSLEVARRTAMNESTVLYHFPSRDDLLVAALLRHEQEPSFQAQDAGAQFALAPGDASRGVATNLNVTRLFVAMAAEATDPRHPAHEFFIRHNAGVIAVFARDVRRRQQDGLADPALDANRVARQILAVWDGLQSQWLVDASFDIAEELELAMQSLTRQDKSSRP